LADLGVGAPELAQDRVGVFAEGGIGASGVLHVS